LSPRWPRRLRGSSSIKRPKRSHQRLAGASGGERRPDGGRAGESFRGSSDQIYSWKKQLLDGAAGVFEGGSVAEGTANEAQVDVLYRQIGQLKVENDFLARKLGK